MRKRRLAALLSPVRFFGNPLVIVFVVGSTASLSLGDRVGVLGIIAMVVPSASLNFSIEVQARRAANEIRMQAATMAAFLHNGREGEPPIAVVTVCMPTPPTWPWSGLPRRIISTWLTSSRKSR